jgi:hypothetical protein
VTHATSFTLSYAVSNAYGTSSTSATLQNCFVGATNSSGALTVLGTLANATSSTQTASFTAPSTAGTYTASLTCGGSETATATLTVQ